MDKLKVKRGCFLSHSIEHGKHADFLKEEILGVCEDTVEVFTFSDPSSLRPGDPWYDKVIKNLRKAKVVLLLLSPSTVNRPWLLFESGGAVALGARTITLRICGLPPELVPGPLTHFESCDLSEREAVIQMLNDLATAQRPQEASLLRAARSIAAYFGNVDKEEVIPGHQRHYLPPLQYRLAALAKLSETQRKLFLHVQTCEGRQKKRGILESEIRTGMPIPYERHANAPTAGELVISASEYYFRLRELYYLGLLDMEKVSAYENRWSLDPEVREFLA